MFFTNEDGKAEPLANGGKRRVVPLLPLRDIIVFPHMVSQLFVGRERSINALDAAMARDKDIFLAAQKNAKTNEPSPDDIFQVGTLGTVMQLLRLPDGTVKVLVEGKRRARIKRFAQTDEFFLTEVEEIPEAWQRGVEIEALTRSVHDISHIGARIGTMGALRDEGAESIGRTQIRLAPSQFLSFEFDPSYPILPSNPPRKRVIRESLPVGIGIEQTGP